MKDGAVILDETFVAKAQKSLNQLKSEYSGEHLYSFPSGDTMSVINYKNGLLDGHGALYFPNGIRRISAEFKDDKLNGEYIEYNENGEILKKSHYSEGVVQL